VIERGSRLRFLLKTPQGLQVSRQKIRQQLESDRAAKLEIFRLVDHPHPATTKRFENSVVKDCFPLQRQNGRVVVIGSDGLRYDGDGCCVQEALWCVPTPEEGFNFQAETRVFYTCPLKKSATEKCYVGPREGLRPSKTAPRSPATAPMSYFRLGVEFL